MTTDAVAATPTTGVWDSISQSASNASNWLNENVWGAVAPFFQGIANHISENSETYKGAIIGAAIGSAVTLVIAYIYHAFCHGTGAPKGESEESDKEGVALPSGGAGDGGAPISGGVSGGEGEGGE